MLTAKILHRGYRGVLKRRAFVRAAKQQIIYMTVKSPCPEEFRRGVRASSVDTWRGWPARNVLMRSFSCPCPHPLHSLARLRVYTESEPSLLPA